MSPPNDPALQGKPLDDELDELQVEQATRWRLMLGRFADDHVGMGGFGPAGGLAGKGARGDLSGLLHEAAQMDRSLSYIYDREQAARSHRQAGGGGPGDLTVPAWLKGVRTLFPQEAVQVMEQDALSRYGLTELVTDPSLLREAQPSQDLLKAILQFKHLMTGDVLDAARDVAKAVVDELSDKLMNETGPALLGSTNPEQQRPVRTFQNTDWNKTIRRNLKHWDPDRERLIAERIYFKHRQKNKRAWRIIVAVDQSGSMTDSLIHASIMAGIFTRLPSVSVNLVLWDHRIVDVSDMAHDPLEVLMSTQLGGGTRMAPAMRYCADLIEEPERTIFVLLSDWYIWGEVDPCLAMAHELHEAGVVGIGLSALDSRARPVCDETFARKLAAVGWFVAALTPRHLAEHIGKLIA